jgi:hypothetical protein
LPYLDFVLTETLGIGEGGVFLLVEFQYLLVQRERLNCSIMLLELYSM